MNSRVYIVLTIIFPLLLSSSALVIDLGQIKDDVVKAVHDHISFENITRDFITPMDRCVRCAFGLVQCCQPNLCVKNTFFPDQCLTIKARR